ncbi:unnamed protein product [Closterium sp. NIES-54]
MFWSPGSVLFVASCASETSPTLRWTGKFVDASVFRVWGALSLVRDANASKLSSRTLCCVFLGFPTDAPPWQLYHPRSRRVFSSQDVTFDESDYFYRLHPHASHPVPLAPFFLRSLLTPLAHVRGVTPPLTTRRPLAALHTWRPPPGFPPRPSSPPPQPPAMDSGAETTGAEPGVGGPGARHPQQPGLVETLSPQQIRAWIVRRESPGGGGYGPAGAGAASPRGTAGAGGAGGTAGGAGGAAGAGGTAGGAGGAAGARGTRGAAGAGGAGGTARGAGGAAGTGGTAGRAGGAAGAGGTRGAAGAGGAGAASPGGTGGAGGAGGAGATSPGGSTSTGGARAASLGGPAGAGGAGAAHAGGAGGTAGAGGAGAGGTGGAGAAGPGGARTGGTGAVGAGGAAGARGASAAGAEGARGATGTGGAGGATGAGGARAEGTRGARAAKAGGAAGAVGAGGATGAAGTRGAGGTAGARGVGAAGARGVAGARGAGGATGAAGAGGAGAAGVGRAGAAGTAPRRLFFYPQPHSSLPPLDSVLRQSLTECREPETRASTPVGARRVARPRPPTIPSTHGMALRPSFVPQRVVLPEPPVSSLPHVPDPESDLAHAAIPTVTRLLAPIIADPDFESTAAFALVTELVHFEARSRLDYVASLVTESGSVCPLSVGGEPALGRDVLEDRQFELECLAAALPRFASMLHCPEGDPNALEIPTPRSYAEAIAGFNQRQGVNFFHNFSPTPKMTTLWVLLHVAAHRDYELHFLDISTAFLQGSLHEEISLHRPPCFTGCEAEIYTGAMAAQELRLRTYLLTDLGERPRSPPVLYVENKAMLALCRE